MPNALGTVARNPRVACSRPTEVLGVKAAQGCAAHSTAATPSKTALAKLSAWRRAVAAARGDRRGRAWTAARAPPQLRASRRYMRALPDALDAHAVWELQVRQMSDEVCREWPPELFRTTGQRGPPLRGPRRVSAMICRARVTVMSILSSSILLPSSRARGVSHRPSPLAPLSKRKIPQRMGSCLSGTPSPAINTNWEPTPEWDGREGATSARLQDAAIRPLDGRAHSGGRHRSGSAGECAPARGSPCLAGAASSRKGRHSVS